MIDVTGMELVSSTLIIGVSGVGSTMVNMTETESIDSSTSVTQFHIMFLVKSAVGSMYVANS
jgi:hypothetical protein